LLELARWCQGRLAQTGGASCRSDPGKSPLDEMKAAEPKKNVGASDGGAAAGVVPNPLAVGDASSASAAKGGAA